jgi:hypothetical protein
VRLKLHDTFRRYATNLPAKPLKRKCRRPLSEIFFSAEQGAVLTFSDFCDELHRHGYLSNNELHLTGRQIRSVYKWLEREHIVIPLNDITEVLYAFKKEFTLQIKSASSLQRIKDDNDDTWRNAFMKQYNMKPVEFGDKFDIRGNELVTTDAHEQERNKACERHATTTQQIARVKIAVDFIKPFKEMEKHITSKEVKLRKRIWIALSCMYCQNFRRKKRTYAECRIR